MTLNTKLQDYLREITGEPLALVRVPESELTGIPFFYCNAYELHKLNWLDKIVIMALPNSDVELSPSEYAQQIEFLNRHFNVPVALVLPHLESYKRKRLIQARIPFVIPGQQLFLPPFADFRERVPRKPIENINQLSAAAQVTLIYHLHKKNADKCSLRELAGKLGYSAMTLSNVCNEFIAAGLCENNQKGKKGKLIFNAAGYELWKLAKPLLSSPVIRKTWMRFEAGRFPLAGMSALTEYTMVNDNSWNTFACRNTMLKKMLKDGQVVEVQDMESADGLFEVWKYAPDTVAKDGCVDRLSLYLSLEDSPDERVQSGLEQLLEEMEW